MKFILITFLIINAAWGSIGTITSVRGDGAKIQRNDTTVKATIGKSILEKDIITTDQNSKVNIAFTDNTFITIGKNSAVNIEEYLYDINNPTESKANLNFFKGAFKSITGNIGKLNPSKLKIKTKNATIGIRGTGIEGNENTIIVTQGSIFLTAGGKTVVVKEGEISFIENQIPSVPKKFSPSERKTVKAQLAVTSKTKAVTFTTNSTDKQTGTTEAKAKNGSVSVNKDGTVTYTPNEGHSGTDTITLITNQSNGIIVTETITVTTPVSSDSETLINLEQVSVLNLDGTEDVLFDTNGEFGPTDDDDFNTYPATSSGNGEDQKQDSSSENPNSSINTNSLGKATQNNNNDNNTYTTLQNSGSSSVSLEPLKLYEWSAISTFNTNNNNVYLDDGITSSKGWNIAKNTTGGNAIQLVNYLSINPKTKDLTLYASGEQFNQNSYYINDDNFGAKVQKNVTITKAQEGFMKAFPDKVSSNGYEYIDNETSWGYWEVKKGDSASTVYYILERGYWMAGNETSSAQVKKYIDGTSVTKMEFKGHVIGSVRNSTGVYKDTSNPYWDHILLDTNNELKLNFDFGGGVNNFTGSFKFNTQYGDKWSGTISKTTLSQAGFKGSATGKINNATNVSGTFGGYTAKFYGSNIKSVGGVFNLQAGTKTAYGVFKADKQ